MHEARGGNVAGVVIVRTAARPLGASSAERNAGPGMVSPRTLRLWRPRGRTQGPENVSHGRHSCQRPGPLAGLQDVWVMWWGAA